MKSKIEKWQRWSKEIHDDLLMVRMARSHYNTVRRFASHHHEGINWCGLGQFFENYRWYYITFAVMTLRRQWKNDNRSKNLRRLMEELRHGADEFSLGEYMRIHGSGRRQDSAYQMFWGKRVRMEKVSRDISRLGSLVMKCEDYADKHIAHIDKKKPRSYPTMHDLVKCVNAFYSLSERYYEFLHCTSFARPDINHENQVYKMLSRGLGAMLEDNPKPA